MRKLQQQHRFGKRSCLYGSLNFNSSQESTLNIFMNCNFEMLSQFSLSPCLLCIGSECLNQPSCLTNLLTAYLITHSLSFIPLYTPSWRNCLFSLQILPIAMGRRKCSVPIPLSCLACNHSYNVHEKEQLKFIINLPLLCTWPLPSTFTLIIASARFV